ncbi:ABC transporter ATP-binding protein [Limosilactobacillus sp. STM2_1]|uniref:ABC-type quaternary amine transporter n=1 Tax=Limosilactobacillus rudii TaxID=2759755 RepID=A0A7W3YPG8_9LACO|nr:ABC transporter ATP-binding protein [Limosilactobacillus rudii]MBB1079300.1 ABC transporter ATP-binding protein [Limosilactobacillus rudii]MBB1098506.1 ABC transporter ATP-binding protein [Limosilactobacillus rudii]MCD7135515.1 ABC transporter ATP-binding protein [Limosilactobacillus rudii]
MTKPIIQFKHVQKTFGSNIIIPDLSFTVNKGEFVTILGSSGSGKTTTLKMINGLLQPSAGEILIDGQKINDLDLVKLRRHMGYVVQQIGLFPHMTISQNIAVVPKMLQWPQNKIEERVNELLKLVQLAPQEYANRYPQQLSGGQQQRIGVARALATNPPYVLFDEPFGALDALTRSELQREIKRIHESLPDKTFLFVTHDINEALFLGQRVMVMHQGKVAQFARPQEIVHHPATAFVKELLGTVQQNKNLWREQDD